MVKNQESPQNGLTDVMKTVHNRVRPWAAIPTVRLSHHRTYRSRIRLSPFTNIVKNLIRFMSVKTDKPNSRNIPSPIRREVRKRCGFGCVICGLPLYEYDHIEDWANVQKHEANNLVLLCDKHHKEKTNKLLPKEIVVEANRNPYNLQNGVSKPYNLHYHGNEAKVELGNSFHTFKSDNANFQLIPLIIDSIPLVKFNFIDNHLLLNLQCLNEYNEPILIIEDNQLLYSVSPWDITLAGRILTIREASRKILIELEFNPPNKVSIKKGRFLCNGIELILKNNGDFFLVNNGNTISGMCGENKPAGLKIGYNPFSLPGIINIKGVKRYNK